MSSGLLLATPAHCELPPNFATAYGLSSAHVWCVPMGPMTLPAPSNIMLLQAWGSGHLESVRLVVDHNLPRASNNPHLFGFDACAPPSPWDPWDVSLVYVSWAAAIRNYRKHFPISLVHAVWFCGLMSQIPYDSTLWMFWCTMPPPSSLRASMGLCHCSPRWPGQMSSICWAHLWGLVFQGWARRHGDILVGE